MHTMPSRRSTRHPTDLRRLLPAALGGGLARREHTGKHRSIHNPAVDPRTGERFGDNFAETSGSQSEARSRLSLQTDTSCGFSNTLGVHDAEKCWETSDASGP